MTKGFVHLHNHTSYSALDGAAKVDELIKAAKADGQPGIAITDHGVLHGLIDFYKTCKKYEINPILGLEAYFADDQNDRSAKYKKKNSDIDGSDKRYYHLTLLAENNTGYQNLIKLSSDAFLEGFYFKPRTDWNKIEQFSSGLIATSGCLGGPVLQELLHDRPLVALEKAARLQDIFGKDNFFIELQNHGIPEQLKTNPQLIEISRELGAPVIAANDLHYVKHEDHIPHAALLCCQTNSKLSDPDRFQFESDQHYLKSAAEMRHLFQDIPDACDQTLLINERVNIGIDFDSLHLPVFDVPSAFESPSAYLAHLSHKGLVKRYGTPTREQEERLAYELGVLETLGLSSYMLIVWDICRFADREGIRRGPARGSVAGSLVAYCMNISKVDPMRHGLLFERFLNPSRVAMPDIDLDWDSRYRDHIINYTREKYGEDHVAQIITFSIIRARAAVRDATRVLGYGPDLGDRISKAMPPLLMGETTPLYACMEKYDRYEFGYKNAADLRDMYRTDPEVQEVVDVALGLEGLIRQDGIHAAGLVISDKPITEYVPIQQRGKDKPIVTQYEKNTIEDLGLLKMDYLGLKNLDVISETLRLIGEDPGVDETEFNDLSTFDLLRHGNTIGVFQLESKPMRQLLQRLQPNSIDDIAAVVALYRPGPMGTNMHYDYADRKNHRQPVSYFHTDAEGVLGQTYGLMIYQEQTMQIAQLFAGYSMVEADGLRKIIGKKLIDKMAAEKDKFVQGCIDQSYGAELGQKLFHMIESFAAYGFNKSHAYGYGYIAYQTAFLKANYPREYLAALCTVFSDELNRCALYLNELKDLGYHVRTPDINKAGVGFTVHDDSVMVGLGAVKNIGTGTASNVVAERESHGEFTSLIDLAQRINPNASELEAYAYSGALDQFGSRYGLATIAPDVLKAVRKDAKKQIVGQDALFDTEPLWQFDVPTQELPRRMELNYEHNALGLYVTGHPLEDYLDESTEWRIAELDQAEDGTYIDMLVLVTSMTTKRTKAGESMSNLEISDQTGNADVVMFPKTWREHHNTISQNDIGILTVRIGRDRSGEQNLIFTRFAKIQVEEQAISTNAFSLYLPEGFAQQDEYIAKLKGTLLSHHGNRPVNLHVGHSSKLQLPNDILVDGSTELIRDVGNLFKDYASR